MVTSRAACAVRDTSWQVTEQVEQKRVFGIALLTGPGRHLLSGAFVLRNLRDPC